MHAIVRFKTLFSVIFTQLLIISMSQVRNKQIIQIILCIEYVPSCHSCLKIKILFSFSIKSTEIYFLLERQKVDLDLKWSLYSYQERERDWRGEETSLKTKKSFLVTRKTHNLSLPALCGCGTLRQQLSHFCVCVCGMEEARKRFSSKCHEVKAIIFSGQVKC